MNGRNAERELTEAIDELAQEVEKARLRFEELRAEYDSLVQAREVLRKRSAPTVRERRRRDQPVTVPVAELREMTQIEMLIAIAERNGGRIKSKWARELMIAAGAFSDPENASTAIYKILTGSNRFESVKRGEYRLVAVRGADAERVGGGVQAIHPTGLSVGVDTGVVTLEPANGHRPDPR